MDTVHSPIKPLPKKPGDDRRYACLICPSTFGRKDRLKRHMETVHSPIKPFKCEHCSTAFNRRDKLKAHIQGVHFKYAMQQAAKAQQAQQAQAAAAVAGQHTQPLQPQQQQAVQQQPLLQMPQLPQQPVPIVSSSAVNNLGPAITITKTTKTIPSNPQQLYKSFENPSPLVLPLLQTQPSSQPI